MTYDTLGQKGELLELNAQDAPVKDIRWDAQEIETKSTALVDDGSGKPIILRKFDFELSPSIPKEHLPSKLQLLQFHKSKVIAFLWKDELELVQEMKLVFDKKNKRKFYIFATCQPKKGSLLPFNVETQLLQDATGPQRRSR